MESPEFQTTLVAEFRDVDQLCHDVQYWDLRFQPLGSIPPDEKIARIVQGNMSRFECTYARFRMNFDQRGAPPQGKVTFTIPGEKLNELWWRDQFTSSSDVLVYLPETELRSISAQDFEVYLIAVDVPVIEEYLERCGFREIELARFPSVFRAPDHVLQKARAVLGRLGRHPRFADPCSLDALVEDLVSCWVMQTGLQPRQVAPSSSRFVIEEILASIASGNAADIRISTLCQKANISRRALEIAFHDKFGTGPSAFLKSARLAQARRKLQTASEAARSIADIMDEAGFSHVGQFALDYRKMFGERPSDTMKRYS
ncbi:AraC-like DNA-binding protein [Labrenzia sp. EL_126]|nr:AraC-like DNA-binding protein [Labrenzia sp. EL_126]